MIAVYCLHAATTFRLLWEVLNKGTLFVYSERRLMQKDFSENSFIYTMSECFYMRAVFKQRLLCFLGVETLCHGS